MTVKEPIYKTVKVIMSWLNDEIASKSKTDLSHLSFCQTPLLDICGDTQTITF